MTAMKLFTVLDMYLLATIDAIAECSGSLSNGDPVASMYIDCDNFGQTTGK